MNYMEMSKSDVLGRAAMRLNKTREQFCAEIQEAIDAAWASERPDAKLLQEKLFPEGKPTPEEFINVLARTVGEELFNYPALS